MNVRRWPHVAAAALALFCAASACDGARAAEVRVSLDSAGGWQASSVIHLQSGQYYTVTGSSAIVSGRLADYLGGPATMPDPGPNGWFNKSAFAPAPQYRWGTSAPGSRTWSR